MLRSRPSTHPLTSMGQPLIALFWWLLVLTDPSVGFAGLSGEEPVHVKLVKALEGVSGSRMLADVTHLSSSDLTVRQTVMAADLRSGLLVAERSQSRVL